MNGVHIFAEYIIGLYLESIVLSEVLYRHFYFKSCMLLLKSDYPRSEE